MLRAVFQLNSNKSFKQITAQQYILLNSFHLTLFNWNPPATCKSCHWFRATYPDSAWPRMAALGWYTLYLKPQRFYSPFSSSPPTSLPNKEQRQTETELKSLTKPYRDLNTKNSNLGGHRPWVSSTAFQCRAHETGGDFQLCKINTFKLQESC